MKKLINGILDFRKNALMDYRAKFSNLAHFQDPDALFIACCDSRVVPNVFASSDPGDLFVVRNIGNIVPPYHEIAHTDAVATENSTGAAIEFSVKNLDVTNIVICGHSDCAAMRHFTEHKSAPEHTFLSEWLKFANPSYQRYLALNKDPDAIHPYNELSRINVIQQLEHLKTYPCVQQSLQQNRLRIHGWWFDLATADIHYLNSKSGGFTLVDEAHAEDLLAEIQVK